MDQRSVLTQLAAIEATLSITDPIAASIKRAYKFFPKGDTILPDTPCFMNSWAAWRLRRANSLSEQTGTVRVQCFVEDADQDRAADIALAFHAKLMTALNAKVTLSGAVSTHSLRDAGSPMPAALERAGRVYIGWEMFVDVVMSEAASFAA